jgi:hypothetical protein
MEFVGIPQKQSETAEGHLGSSHTTVSLNPLSSSHHAQKFANCIPEFYPIFPNEIKQPHRHLYFCIFNFFHPPIHHLINRQDECNSERGE